MQDILQHHGILGQKWGVRRYQNEDGTLTSAGKARYESKRAIANESSNIINNAKMTNTEISKMRKQTASSKMDVSDMSDSDLQKEVSRMNLERQYKDLKSSQKTSGQAYVQNILTLAGSAVATTASALAIAVSIKNLRGK